LHPLKIAIVDKQVIHTNLAPAPVGPYNQAIVATGKMLFVSGQIAIDPATNQLAHSDDVAQQTELVMANLAAILQAAGASFADVVKTGVYLQNMNDFATVNAIYARYFDEATAPARACVEVARLPKDVLVEIDCIAVVS
jgi:2-iminobutanoate/2-iminopropanoate deaminase